MTKLFSHLEDVEETVRFATSSGLTGLSLTLVELHNVEHSGITLAFRTPGKFFFNQNQYLYFFHEKPFVVITENGEPKHCGCRTRTTCT